MKVLGTPLANQILEDIKNNIRDQSLKPTLAIILANNSSASRTYIKYKIKAADKVGINIKVYEFSASVGQECIEAVNSLNVDNQTNGIIIQMPLYQNWNSNQLINLVTKHKDVDGFLQDSPFIPATAQAIWKMLDEFASIEHLKSTEQFLSNKKIVILGKGRAAGWPTINLLRHKGFNPQVIDSKTKDSNLLIKQADIIISAAGKPNIINSSNIKKDCYIIGVGISNVKDEMIGDVNELEIKDLAKLYCPTLRGVGPLTIAYLLQNVYLATKNNL